MTIFCTAPRAASPTGSLKFKRQCIKWEMSWPSPVLHLKQQEDKRLLLPQRQCRCLGQSREWLTQGDFGGGLCRLGTLLQHPPILVFPITVGDEPKCMRKEHITWTTACWEGQLHSHLSYNRFPALLVTACHEQQGPCKIPKPTFKQIA